MELIANLARQDVEELCDALRLHLRVLASEHGRQVFGNLPITRQLAPGEVGRLAGRAKRVVALISQLDEALQLARKYERMLSRGKKPKCVVQLVHGPIDQPAGEEAQSSEECR
jgi:hypothetical protein